MAFDFSEMPEHDGSQHLEVRGRRGKRQSVCSERLKDAEIDEFTAPRVAKAEEVTQWLCSVLETEHLFSHLDDRDLAVAVGAMAERRCAGGEVVKQEGAEGDDMWYIVWEGEFDQTQCGEARLLRRGDSFGEMQLLHFCPMQSTVIARGDGTLFGVTRQVYRSIAAQASKAKRAKYEGFLSRVKWLQGMGDAERCQLADALKSARYAAGDLMIRYGDEGQWFHIIEEGTVEVIGQRDGGAVKVCEFTAGDCVGELEFLHNHRCVADVRCVGEVRSAKMNRRHFEMCMGPVVDVLRRTAAESDTYEYYRAAAEAAETGVAGTPAPAPSLPAPAGGGDPAAAPGRGAAAEAPADAGGAGRVVPWAEAEHPSCLVHDVSQVPITDPQIREEWAKLDPAGAGYCTKAAFAKYWGAVEKFGICDTLEESEVLRPHNALGDDRLAFHEFAVVMLQLSRR